MLELLPPKSLVSIKRPIFIPVRRVKRAPRHRRHLFYLTTDRFLDNLERSGGAQGVAPSGCNPVVVKAGSDSLSSDPRATIIHKGMTEAYDCARNPVGHAPRAQLLYDVPG